MQWLIIGAGVHGTIIAHALLEKGGLTHGQLRVIDPHDQPLEAWDRRVENCGMRFLRSPAAHGVVPEFTSLRRWATANGFGDTDFRPPYSRPSVELFRAHSGWAVARSGVSRCLMKALVTAIRRDGDDWIATTDDGQEIAAKHLVVATGRSGAGGRPLLEIPEWSRGVTEVECVLSEGFSRARIESAERPIVVGGGATAAHLAVSLARAGRGVRLLLRHELRVHQFDSEPCFIGPRCYEQFLHERDPQKRREVINEARHPGSVPSDLAEELEHEEKAKRVTLVRDEIVSARQRGDQVILQGIEGRYQGDMLAIATGFRSATPADHLLGDIQRATTNELRRDRLGRPILDGSLQWAPGVFLTGTLAEQELGPTAPNIIGAHNAAKRIITHIAGRRQAIPRAWSTYPVL